MFALPRYSDFFAALQHEEKYRVLPGQCKWFLLRRNNLEAAF